MNASAFVAGTYPTQWKKPPFISNQWLRYGLLLGAVTYLILGLNSIEINWIRVWDGLPRGWAFVSGFLTPDFFSRGADIREGIIESLTMTLTSTVIGILISVPIGIGAARNLAPAPVYLVCRSIIALSRSFQEVIIAILFVVMVGFVRWPDF